MTASTTLGTGIDALRASVQAEVLAHAPDHIARLTWSRDQIEARQREQLRSLLAHAIRYSPFHRRRLRTVDPDRFELPKLDSLPVMTKAEMMRSLDEIFTDRRLNRQLVEDVLAVTLTEPIPIFGDYAAVASGGVSGERGVFVFDSAALAGFLLSIWRSLMARLHAVGGSPGGFPIAMVAAASAVHATRSACAWAAGGKLPFYLHPVPVTLPLRKIVRRLNQLQAPGLVGYPTMLARLAAERRVGRLRIDPVHVTTTSETLTPELRAAIKAGFGVPIVDTFGSSEGLVGSTAPDDPVLRFNSDLCIVELVDDAYRPVSPGIPSSKVLVTNLYNRLQPLIRYELGDSLVREPDAPEHGHLRARVRGRTDEILRYQGVNIHPLVVRSVMVKSPAVLDYQVRQTLRGMDVEAVATGTVDGDRLSEHLAEALRAAGLQDPAVSVRIVDRLNRHSETGKLSRFVPLPT